MVEATWFGFSVLVATVVDSIVAGVVDVLGACWSLSDSGNFVFWVTVDLEVVTAFLVVVAAFLVVVFWGTGEGVVTVTTGEQLWLIKVRVANHGWSKTVALHVCCPPVPDSWRVSVYLIPATTVVCAATTRTKRSGPEVFESLIALAAKEAMLWISVLLTSTEVAPPVTGATGVGTPVKGPTGGASGAAWGRVGAAVTVVAHNAKNRAA